MKPNKAKKVLILHKKPDAKKSSLLKPPSSSRANAYFIGFFFVCAVLLYGNTILNRYALDDDFVTNNAQVKKGLSALPEIFTSFYVTQTGNLGSQHSDYRPVVKATFALEHQLWGEKPGRSHALNVLIYFALSILLFFTLKRLLKSYNILFPFLITLIFMVHPVHTEVVASLKNRDEMLAFLCGLGGLWHFMNYAEKRSILSIFYALVIFFIGYLCKSSILPFLFLYLLVLYFFYDFPAKRLGLIFLALLVVVLIARFGPRYFLPDFSRVNSFIENPLYVEKGLWIRLGTGLMTLLFYLKILFYPYPLLFYYGYNMIPLTNLANIWVILSLFIHIGLFGFAIWKLKEKHILSFAILWYLLAIAMYSNIVVPAVGMVAERFVFTASVGFCIALVYLLFVVFKTNPQSLTIEFDAKAKIWAIVILIFIPCSIHTINRNTQWRSLFSLYKSDIKHLGNSAKANLQWAGFLMRSVYLDETFLRHGAVNQLKQQTIISHFRRALDLYPNNYQTLNDLGTVYLFFAKNVDSATYFLNKAIELNPKLEPAWVNLGMAYRQEGKYDKAIECYERILKNNPNQIKAIFSLANIYNDMGDFNRAVKMNEEVMKAYPSLDMPYINIGNYYMLKTDTATAVHYWELAAERNPSYELCVHLTNLYRVKGDKEKAEYYYRLGQQAKSRTP